MGSYNHIALHYTDDIFELGENAYVIPFASDKRDAGREALTQLPLF